MSGFERRNTLKKGSKLNVKGVEVLENMDLRENFDPKDGVNLYEWTGGYEQRSPSDTKSKRSNDKSTLKY